MINRSTLMPNAISPKSLGRFIAELSKRTDSPLRHYSLPRVGNPNPGASETFDPLIVSLLVDTLSLWEAEKWRFLTMADNARLNPTGNVFPNTTMNL